MVCELLPERIVKLRDTFSKDQEIKSSALILKNTASLHMRYVKPR